MMTTPLRHAQQARSLGRLARRPCNLAEAAAGTSRPVAQALAFPFDVVRSQYAKAVQLGLIERSMLAGRDFERALGAIERFTLGPWARHV